MEKRIVPIKARLHQIFLQRFHGKINRVDNQGNFHSFLNKTPNFSPAKTPEKSQEKFLPDMDFCSIKKRSVEIYTPVKITNRTSRNSTKPLSKSVHPIRIRKIIDHSKTPEAMDSNRKLIKETQKYTLNYLKNDELVKRIIKNDNEILIKFNQKLKRKLPKPNILLNSDRKILQTSNLKEETQDNFDFEFEDYLKTVDGPGKEKRYSPTPEHEKPEVKFPLIRCPIKSRENENSKNTLRRIFNERKSNPLRHKIIKNEQKPKDLDIIKYMQQIALMRLGNY